MTRTRKSAIGLVLTLIAMLGLTVVVAQHSEAKGKDKFVPYEVSACWTMFTTDEVEGTYQWPQRRGCEPPACGEVLEQQHDTYWIRDIEDEIYLEHLILLMSPGDDNGTGGPHTRNLEPHDYYSVVLTGPKCEQPSEEPTPTDEPTPSETPTAPPTETVEPSPTPTPTTPESTTPTPTVPVPTDEPPATEPPTLGPPPTVGPPPAELRTLHRYTCTAKWSVTQGRRDGKWVTTDRSPKVPIDGNCTKAPEGPRFDETGF